MHTPAAILIFLIAGSLTAAGLMMLIAPGSEPGRLSGVFDFGSRPVGELIEHTFRFVSQSDDTVYIVRTGCGCSTVDFNVPYKMRAGEEVAVPVRVRLLKAANKFRVPIRLKFTSQTVRDDETVGNVTPKPQP